MPLAFAAFFVFVLAIHARLWYTVRMNTPGTGSSRDGKYCPRCRTMAFRDRERCERCGHQFRSGLGAPPLDAPVLDEATLNRTMQFTLPPLAPREVVAAPDADPAAPLPRRRHVPALAPAAVGGGPALAGAPAYFHYAQAARAAKPSPVGVWETTPAGRASPSARLRLTLRDDGSGSFSWQGSRRTPLRWQLDPDGRLVLIIPAPADPVSGTLITILDSHPWLWRVDRAQHRLIIGTLDFTEK